MLGVAQRFGVPMGLGDRTLHSLQPMSRLLGSYPEESLGSPRMFTKSCVEDGDPDTGANISDGTKRQATSAQLKHCSRLSALYGIYHGPEGLKEIADRTQSYTAALAVGLTRLGHHVFGGGLFLTPFVSDSVKGECTLLVKFPTPQRSVRSICVSMTMEHWSDFG